MKKILKNIIKIFLYIAATMYVYSGMIIISNGKLYGILFIITGILFMPIMYRKIRFKYPNISKKNIRIIQVILPIVFMYICSNVTPNLFSVQYVDSSELVDKINYKNGKIQYYGVSSVKFYTNKEKYIDILSFYKNNDNDQLENILTYFSIIEEYEDGSKLYGHQGNYQNIMMLSCGKKSKEKNIIYGHDLKYKKGFCGSDKIPLTLEQHRKKEKNKKEKEKQEKRQIIATLDRYTYHSKHENDTNPTVTLEKENHKYVATILLKPGYDYNTALDCGVEFFNTIKNLKKDYPKIYSKVSLYQFEFYSRGNLKYRVNYENNGDEIINSIIVESTNGELTTITQQDIDNHYAELRKKIEDSINKNDTQTVSAFDENNINKKIKCKEKEITIKKMQRVNNSSSSYVPDGHEWVGIYIVYKNTSKNDIYYSESDFKLVNNNKQVLDPSFVVIKGIFDHTRLNNGQLASGGVTEGYVIFDNEIIDDKNLIIRITCEDNLIKDDVVKKVELR